ncbi:MAG: PepSY domain-containing protein [Rubrivivax sp.]|nr:PepSY domain-containing protein [Rubrivivax sp.]
MAAWFLSGVVMLYVGYPKLTTEERLAGLPPLRAETCCVPLSRALAAAQAVALPAQTASAAPARGAATRQWRLTSVAGEPRYVLAEGLRRLVAVDARSGEAIRAVSAADALASARHFAGGQLAGEYLGRVDEDAWTHSRALDAHRPLHLVAVQDEFSRWLYVSSRTGEVVRDATRTERTWGWLGAWLHWLYMFRGGPVDAWWTRIIIGLSIACGVSVLTGLVVGVWRWRFRGTYKGGRRSPYSGFVARWHHILGLVGGLLAFTWVLSGLLSVNPWKVFDAPGAKPDRAAYAGGPLVTDAAAGFPEAADAVGGLLALGLAPREIEWRRVGGVMHAVALGPGGPWVVQADGVPAQSLPAARWREAAARLLPGARIVQAEHVTRFDRYYYAREPHTMTGQRERPLPVWRLRFDDANETWITLDPRTGDIVAQSDRRRRVDRWLFAFLHSFDLPQWLAARPAWDAWMLGFSLAGLGMSLTAVVAGWRRLRRKLRANQPIPLAAAASSARPQP